MKLTSRATPIAGVMVVTSAATQDARGSFVRLYCEQELAPLLGGRRVVQVNHSRTRARGAIRGLHYQRAPHGETKFVRCLKGRVWDVVVDLRAGSPTLLHWHAEELAASDWRMVVIPEGCAHGFQTLERDSELLYLHTTPYAPPAEAGVRFDDPRLAVAWPLPAADLSERDLGFAPLGGDFAGLKP